MKTIENQRRMILHERVLVVSYASVENRIIYMYICRRAKLFGKFLLTFLKGQFYNAPCGCPDKKLLIYYLDHVCKKNCFLGCDIVMLQTCSSSYKDWQK